MGLANCKECGKIYMQTAAGLCPDCYRVEEAKEQKVAHYLQDHGQSSVSEVHEATGVSETTILKMIKKGRIIGNTALSYSCEKCGKQIMEGRVCQECGNKLRGLIKPSSAPRTAQRTQSSKWKSEGFHTTITKK